MNTRYITCLYWAIQTMTTIGYGDVPLFSDNERILAIMVMFMSSGIYGYSLNKISQIILDLGRTQISIDIKQTVTLRTTRTK